MLGIVNCDVFWGLLEEIAIEKHVFKNVEMEKEF